MRQFHKPSSGPSGKELSEDVAIRERVFSEGKPGLLVIDDGEVSGVCLNCPDTPCVFYSESEIFSPVLDDFPFNRSRDVCPYSAISVDNANLLPVIDDRSCVGCGICVARCPANALYVNSRGTVSVSDGENRAIKCRSSRDEASHKRSIHSLSKSVKSGHLRKVDLPTLERVINDIVNSGTNNTAQKLLVRNLIMAIGGEAAISSVGDTNVRIDMWWAHSGLLWVTEVDFDIVSLVDSPRGLLDDVAVCVSRHGVAKDSIRAMIVCLEFPNKRSDYYHIVEDVKSILNIEICTVSVAGLLLAMWTHRTLGDIDFANCVALRGSETVAGGFRSITDSPSILRSRYFSATK